LWYMLRNRIRKLTGHSYPLSISQKGHSLSLQSGIPKPSTFDLDSEALAQESLRLSTSTKSFTFLNQTQSFEGAINWNTNTRGKLWAYNLNYFDYLHQPEMTKEQGLALIRAFIKQIEDNREGLEPYPISLRGINWIKFLNKYEIQDPAIDANLYAQYQILLDNPEYHVDGNHLMENGCSLLFGACYFRDEQLWDAACSLITQELQHEVLGDGGHYERSVMYHCIILERLLDSYNLLSQNRCFADQDQLEEELAINLQQMLGWLRAVQWESGALPEVNDHVAEMAPSVSGLFEYAQRLGLQAKAVALGESGYRKCSTSNYELLADVGDIGPDYVLGHAHSDTFSFLLRIGGQEVITDTGTSTYENNRRRQMERSTAAHNTVMVDGKEQQEVWSAFRVGRRGHVERLKDEPNEIIARHD